jgi:hypothetical protein
MFNRLGELRDRSFEAQHTQAVAPVHWSHINVTGELPPSGKRIGLIERLA